MFQQNIQDTPIAAPHGSFRTNEYQEPDAVSYVIPTPLTKKWIIQSPPVLQDICFRIA